MDIISDRSYQLRLIALGIKRGIPPQKTGAEIIDAVAEYLDWLDEELWEENEKLHEEIKRGRIRHCLGCDRNIGKGGDEKGLSPEPLFITTECNRGHEEVLHASTNEDPSILDIKDASKKVVGENRHNRKVAHRVKTSKKSKQRKR